MPEYPLSLVAIQHEVENGPTVTISRRPVRFRVLGLAPPDEAEIVEINGRWQILRASGEETVRSETLYPTAEAALVTLQNAVA